MAIDGVLTDLAQRIERLENAVGAPSANRPKPQSNRPYMERLAAYDELLSKVVDSQQMITIKKILADFTSKELRGTSPEIDQICDYLSNHKTSSELNLLKRLWDEPQKKNKVIEFLLENFDSDAIESEELDQRTFAQVYALTTGRRLAAHHVTETLFSEEIDDKEATAITNIQCDIGTESDWEAVTNPARLLFAILKQGSKPGHNGINLASIKNQLEGFEQHYGYKFPETTDCVSPWF